MTQNNHNKNIYGFTLVELAIVMIIIGLLLGGVLKGQQLIENSRRTRLISDVKSYIAAFNTFNDRYNAMPGDMRNAGTRIPNCIAGSACNIAGGNGDNILGTITNNWSRDNQSAIALEPTQFWVQMGLSGMLSGLNLQNNQAWGDVYPASPLGGGFQMAEIFETGNNQAQGLYFILRLPPTGDAHPVDFGDAVLSPSQLANIEAKIDDGIPNRGDIVADDAGRRCWNTITGEYNGAETRAICLTAFRIR